jgi:hypothetical protein
MGWRQNWKRETPAERERRIWGDPNKEWEGEAPSGGYRYYRQTREGTRPRYNPPQPPPPLPKKEATTGAPITLEDIGPRYIKDDIF